MGSICDQNQRRYATLDAGKSTTDDAAAVAGFRADLRPPNAVVHSLAAESLERLDAHARVDQDVVDLRRADDRGLTRRGDRRRKAREMASAIGCQSRRVTGRRVSIALSRSRTIARRAP